jgi:hypothetical protein
MPRSKLAAPQALLSSGNQYRRSCGRNCSPDRRPHTLSPVTAAPPLYDLWFLAQPAERSNSRPPKKKLDSWRPLNLTCDKNTVEILSHPLMFVLDDIRPLEPRKNVNSANHYYLFCHEVDNQFVQNECQPFGIVCDNFQAQVSGIGQFISEHKDMTVPVMHMPCCSHWINLVFISSHRTNHRSEMKTRLESTGRILQSRHGCLIVGLHCSRMVQTRWFHMAGVLQFVFSHFFDVQTSCYPAGHEPISPG